LLEPIEVKIWFQVFVGRFRSSRRAESYTTDWQHEKTKKRRLFACPLDGTGQPNAGSIEREQGPTEQLAVFDGVAHLEKKRTDL
jgi:hypothetical protein